MNYEKGFGLRAENPESYRNERELKEAIRKAFNEVLSKNDWDDCENSTSALTTQERIFNKEKDQFFGHEKTPKIVDFRAFPSAARSGIEPLILP